MASDRTFNRQNKMDENQETKSTAADARHSCPTPGSEILAEIAQWHERMASVRKGHAQETREAIEYMDDQAEERPKNFQANWEDTKAFNIQQAEFDQKEGERHQRYAAAIRELLSQNAKSSEPN